MHCSGTVSLILLLGLAVGAGALTPTQIDQLTKPVLKGIQDKEYAYLQTSYENITTEGVPASFKFYIADFNMEKSCLVACQVSVGHETWGNTFTYFFDKAGHCLKYTKEVFGREDHPVPIMVYFDEHGLPLGKEPAQPPVKPDEIVKLFRTLETQAEALSNY